MNQGQLHRIKETWRSITPIHFFSMAVTKVPRKKLKEGRFHFTRGFRSVNTTWQGRGHDGEKQSHHGRQEPENEKVGQAQGKL